ncbi:MAG: hypothetical protein MR210_08830 [Erysipelotrichaceae bacterium]|nr:hypothetical protein [Erysipelotrichaceae bacterium]MDY5252464.1 hypothetical protein [Erysipelotrichaceae bacterium]
MKFADLRKQYPTFIYHDYKIDEDEKTIKLTFDFEIVGLEHFAPTFTLHKNTNQTFASFQQVDDTAFYLGMVELISYWKITCSPNVIIACHQLDAYQIAWFKKLYYKGLGEFFYVNDIKIDDESFMNITTTKAIGKNLKPYDLPVKGNIICVGGGKDSFVTLDLLKEEFEQNHALVINKVQSALHSAIKAGYDGEKLINPLRTLDPRMLALNKQGFLNGHTPFSAMVAFASYFIALVYQKQYICLSNEASANESTIKGEDVNHQYSKSYEFEVDFKDFVEHYLDPQINYFSLLRCMSEMQITRYFANLREYHTTFKSCNVGSKQEIWCNNCAKCLFVYIMLSAHLDDEQLDNIFHEDLLAKASLLKTFDELCGIDDNKPFECVGTRDEVNAAICLAIKKRDQLPLLYQHYMESANYAIYKDKDDYANFYNAQHLIPEQFLAILEAKGAIKR